MRVWALLANKLPPGELFAIHVLPWVECTKIVDVMLPRRRIIVCHDGRSHFEAPMPTDRAAGNGAKWECDRKWDSEARKEGWKVVRLHWRDEAEWEICLDAALHSHADLSPVYSPSYASLPPASSM